MASRVMEPHFLSPNSLRLPQLLNSRKLYSQLSASYFPFRPQMTLGSYKGVSHVFRNKSTYVNMLLIEQHRKQKIENIFFQGFGGYPLSLLHSSNLLPVPWLCNVLLKLREKISCLQHSLQGFPGSSASKESACNAEEPGRIPGSGRSPREVIGYPLQYS